MDTARRSVVDVYRRLLEAWNRRDADAFATLFTSDGSAVGFDGSQMNGRNEIRSSVQAIFADHQTAAYVASIREVRALDANATLIRSAVGMTPPGTRQLNPATNAIQSLVMTFESGEPRVALLHNTPAAFHGRPQLGDALTAELTAVVDRGRVVQE